MSEIRAILRDLREQRRAHDADLRLITEEQMGAAADFTFETMITRQCGETSDADVRWMFLRRPDHLEEHAIQIEAWLRSRFGVEQSQAQRFWAANQEARGDLYAALVGLTDEDLDDAPVDPPGEWPLRTTLEHVLAVEHSYAANAVAAVECYRAGLPWESPDLSGNPTSWPDATIAELIGMIDRARDESLDILLDLPDGDLKATRIWAGIEIDVRFALMRFAHHEREHTQQIRKWRQQAGKPFSEADRLLGLCWQRSARLEGILAGAPDDVLDRDPGDGEWTVRAILEHIAGAELYYKRVIDDALA